MEPEHFEALYPETTRFEEIEKIMHYVKEGGSCQIVGVPGVSRSTLLGILAYNKHIRNKHLGEKQKMMHFVLANFSEIRKRPLFDAMKFLFLTLASSLRERRMMEEYEMVNSLFRESLSFHDELVLFQGLKDAIDYLALEKKMTIVFLFDRFEDYVPTVSSEFFTNLRILRNRAKFQFSIVFSLNRPLEVLLEPSLLADFYEFVAGHIVYLQLYDKVSTDFRISYIEKVTGKKLSAKVKESIIKLTGGHGKLTKLAIETTLGQEIGEKDLAEFLLSQKSVRGAMMEIWLSLSPSEQADMQQGAFTDASVLEYLEGVGLVKEGKIAMPLFATFINSAFGTTQKSEEKIVYDENTNTICKGEVVLSDQLTASEFRALRYLLQNQDKVVERDEIVSVVWQNVKSTAGITDQAIDQLIFRVRRKIEEDPNNPQNLQTVKGRGFKFVA
jgi:DNA-binding winged helix-turn-helix (wHTH) protein